MPVDDLLPSTEAFLRLNPLATHEPPFSDLPAVAFLTVDALQMGGEFVAQLVEGAAGFGGVDLVAGVVLLRRQGRAGVLVDLAEGASEAGERLQGALGALDGLGLQDLGMAFREAPEPLDEVLARMGRRGP